MERTRTSSYKVYLSNKILISVCLSCITRGAPSAAPARRARWAAAPSRLRRTADIRGGRIAVGRWLYGPCGGMRARTGHTSHEARLAHPPRVGQTAHVRAEPRVVRTEQMGYTACGMGEHVWTGSRRSFLAACMVKDASRWGGVPAWRARGTCPAPAGSLWRASGSVARSAVGWRRQGAYLWRCGASAKDPATGGMRGGDAVERA